MPSVRFRAVVLCLAVLAAACGSGAIESADKTDLDTTDLTDPAPKPSQPAIIQVADRALPTGSTNEAGAAITKFGVDLFGAVRASSPATSNVTVSPASVAIALAMLEPGTSGEATEQLHELLQITDPATFHASMNALEQDLEARAVETRSEEEGPGEVVMRIANAAYLQDGYPFEAAYLDAVGTSYGPVIKTVDFAPDPDAIAHQINAFVADNTNDKITDLIADGVIVSNTVLALVNALYLKASWSEPFNGGTTDAPFTLLDGTEIKAPLMFGGGASSAQGEGWVGATKHYVGGLSAQFILPDEGRFDAVAANLDVVFANYEASRTTGGLLALPRFETRFNSEVSEALRALGLTAPYQTGNLLNLANDRRLIVGKVIHETFVAMNEEGTEAAAATSILVALASAAFAEPVPVVLDRPFLYRIVDDRSGATLFIGQIVDPTA